MSFRLVLDAMIPINFIHCQGEEEVSEFHYRILKGITWLLTRMRVTSRGTITAPGETN